MPTNELVEKIVDSITKEFGKGSIMTLSRLPDSGVEQWISTGSALLNNAIGRPGLPIGRLSSICGKPAAGKTTMATHVLIETQKAGGIAVLLDTEAAFAPDRAMRMGIDKDSLIIMQPDHCEDCFLKISKILDITKTDKTNRFVTIVWDSVSGTPTRAEVDADDDATRSEIASHARLFSLHLRKICKKIQTCNVCLVLINQMKENPMVMWGSATSFLAEKPIRFHSTVIIDVTQRGKTDDGIITHARISKNKVAPPYKECDIDVTFDHGYDTKRQLFEAAVQAGLVEVSGGGWYKAEGVSKSFFQKDFERILEEFPELNTKVLALVGA